MSINKATLGIISYRRFVSGSTLINATVKCKCLDSFKLQNIPGQISFRRYICNSGSPFQNKLFGNDRLKSATSSAASIKFYTSSTVKSSQSRKRLLEEPEETEPHVIYKGLLSDQMKRLKIFSLTTSGMGLMMQPILIQKASEVSVGANVAVFGMVGFFTFVTPFLIHTIARKYVTEIMYDPSKDQYKATTYSFFLQKNEIDFTMENINVPDVPGPFTTLVVSTEDNKKRSLFVAPESFLKPSHYGRFMGYDKPLDLRLTNTENNTDSKKIN